LAYDELLKNLRALAGLACHTAWLASPAQSDADMNFAEGVVDLSPLKQYEDAYIAAVRAHLDSMLSLKRLWHRR
jgi:hypothetical protein